MLILQKAIQTEWLFLFSKQRESFVKQMIPFSFNIQCLVKFQPTLFRVTNKVRGNRVSTCCLIRFHLHR